MFKTMLPESISVCVKVRCSTI